mgnify:CR=1 FL=1
MFIKASGFVWHIEGRAVSFAKLNSLNACFCLNNLLGISEIMVFEVIRVCLTYFTSRAVFQKKI